MATEKDKAEAKEAKEEKAAAEKAAEEEPRRSPLGAAPKQLPPDVEVAQRSADVHAAKSKRYVKVYAAGLPYYADEDGDVNANPGRRGLPESPKKKERDWDKYPDMHEANKNELVVAARNAGVAVTGDVKFDGAEPNPAAPETSTLLTYSAPAVPTHTVTPGI
jgi:hypothetical protein